MAKITLPTISSGFASTVQYNNALETLETEFQDKVLYRNNPTGEPNQMENDIDMNSNDIINVGSINGISTLLLNDLSSYVAQAENARDAALVAETNAELAEVGATTAEANAVSSAAAAAVYSSIGLGGAAAFDLGLITDSVIIFPTDWGTLV